MGNLRPLFPYIRKYRRRLVVGLISILLTNAILIQFPLIIQHAIDDLNHGIRQRLITYLLLLLAVAVGQAIFQFLTRWIMVCISREIEFDLRNNIFRHLESLSCSFYQRTRTGDIMARATNDLNAVRMLMGPAIMFSANTILFTTGALIFMIRISPKLTAWAFLPLPFASIALQYFGGRIHQRFERIQAMFSDISAHAQENFSGARVIRAYAQEEAEIHAFEAENNEYIARNLRLVRLMGMLWPTLMTLLGLAIVLVLWLGGREVLTGRMTVGSLVAFNAYMVQLSGPVISMGWIINIVQSGRASMGRINQILTEVPEIIDDPAAVHYGTETPIRGEIEFRNLSFAYRPSAANDSQRPPLSTLTNINLHIPAGSSLAIVGPTGSGKSTLVSLIARIYDADPGTVLIDGHPIREFRLQHLRRNIGFVPQETFLFSDTIARNIGFGVELATPDEIRHAAEIAGIDSDIEDFPEKYATLVGERGLTLSGGQKQRTAIARAVIRNPRILVLDDALASVDTQTEEHILNRLRQVMRGCTTIFISHRASTVRNADRIAVLHHGQIVEYGTHDELLVHNGYYAALHNKQLLEEELETI